MSKAGQIVAVNGDTDKAGAIVYWTLRGSVQHAELTDAWEAAGFDAKTLPAAPAPDTACNRALGEQKSERNRRLARPLEGYKGRALVQETAEGLDLSHEVTCTATVNLIGEIEVQTDDDDLRDRIEAAYRRILFKELSTGDISGWVVGTLLAEVDAVALKPTGGSYFIPRSNIERWEAMTAAISAASNHSFYSIPAMNTEDAIEAILASVTHEARALAEKQWTELQKGELGHRALRSREQEIVAMEEKVQRYERVLGLAMPELAEVLEKVQASLVASALKDEGGESYADDFAGEDLGELMQL